MGDSQRIQVPAFVTAFAIILMVWRDLFMSHIDYGWYHGIGKAFFFIACLAIGFYARYKVRGESPKLLVTIVLVVFLNCAHSLAYEPAFHSGYNTTLLLVLFIYNKSMRGFVGLLLFSYVLLVATLFISGVQPGPEYVNQWRNNILIDHLVISLIIWFLYHGVMKQVQERELLYGQFLDVGRKTSMIVHDLKGGLSAPLLYVDIAKERSRDPQSLEVLNKLKDDLEFLNLYANELNQFTARGDTSTKEFFRLSEAVRSMAILAMNEFSFIHIVIDGDCELYLNKYLFRRILMNALLNASEAAASLKRRVTVTVTMERRKLLISDDGPGFDLGVLKGIQRGKSVTTKPEGSGLGCRIISEYAKLMGGKTRFSNRPEGGAVVEIEFPDGRFERISEERMEVTDAPF